MKLGLAQTDIVWEDKKSNLHRAERLIRQAAEEEIDCLLFPEMTLTGFSMNIKEIGEKENDSETVKAFSRYAAAYGIAVGAGYVQKSGDRALNRYVLLGKKGELAADYAKIHPFSFGEESLYYKGGESVACAYMEDMTVSPFICYDLRFPEIFQIASKKAHLITVAANWPEERKGHWLALLQARAVENQCYIAGVNRIGGGNGQFYSGDSVIFSPYGQCLTKPLDREGILSAVIDKDTVLAYREAFRLKSDRREELYKKLAEQA